MEDQQKNWDENPFSNPHLLQLEKNAKLSSLMWNVETGTFWWSEQFDHILNLTVKKTTPSLSNLISFFHPSEQSHIQRRLERLAREHTGFRINSTLLSPSGAEIPVVFSLEFDDNKNTATGFIQDVSDDFAERKSLQETLSKYRGVMSGAGDAIVLITQEGSVLEGNAKAAELLEVPLEELSQLSIDTIHMEDELDHMMGHYQGMLWGQQNVVQSCIKGQQGTVHQVEITGRAVTIENQQMLVVILHDVTDQQKAKDNLKRSEKRYRTLVDEAREGILLLSNDGEILEANPKICEETQIHRLKLIGRTFEEITDFEMETGPIEILKLNPKRPSIHMEGYLRASDDTLVPTGFSVARYNETGTSQFIVTAYDLSGVRQGEEDRLQLQKQLFQAQKQELLGQLAGSLAHDFNNLLSPILLVSETLIEDAEDDYFRKNLQNVNQAAQRARRLVGRILDYTRPEESEFSLIDLRHETAETLELLRSSIPNMITIEEKYSDENFMCHGDPDQIHQILMNLGTNAAQAIGDENGVIHFCLNDLIVDEQSELMIKHELPEGRYACLSVKNTGPGIPEEYLDKIFDPFFTTKSQTDGSGLGLSVVERIATNHGGVVEVMNTQEDGAQFDVYLPLLD